MEFLAFIGSAICLQFIELVIEKLLHMRVMRCAPRSPGRLNGH